MKQRGEAKTNLLLRIKTYAERQQENFATAAFVHLLDHFVIYLNGIQPTNRGE